MTQKEKDEKRIKELELKNKKQLEKHEKNAKIQEEFIKTELKIKSDNMILKTKGIWLALKDAAKELFTKNDELKKELKYTQDIVFKNNEVLKGNEKFFLEMDKLLRTPEEKEAGKDLKHSEIIDRVKELQEPPKETKENEIKPISKVEITPEITSEITPIPDLNSSEAVNTISDTVKSLVSIGKGIMEMNNPEKMKEAALQAASGEVGMVALFALFSTSDEEELLEQKGGDKKKDSEKLSENQQQSEITKELEIDHINRQDQRLEQR